MTGLIIGSMIPDFEYFMRMNLRSEYSHTLPGLFWFDLPLGLAIVIVYQVVVKDKLIDNLPAFLNPRFSKYRNTSVKTYSFKYLVVIALCILAGAASHILWDSFTHPTGYFVAHIPALVRTIPLFHHDIFIYKILQHASSLIGAMVIATFIYYLPLGSTYKVNNITRYWVRVLVMIFLTLFIKLLFSYRSLGEVIVTAIAGLFLGLTLASIAADKHGIDIDSAR